jgi:hypothetical protein
MLDAVLFEATKQLPPSTTGGQRPGAKSTRNSIKGFTTK